MTPEGGMKAAAELGPIQSPKPESKLISSGVQVEMNFQLALKLVSALSSFYGSSLKTLCKLDVVSPATKDRK